MLSKEKVQERFIQNIRYLRKKEEHTILSLSEEENFPVGKSAIGHLEAGNINPSLYYAQVYSKFFNVAMETLLEERK